MSADKRALLKERLASGKATLEPLTFPQRELWEASPVTAEDPANHICCFIEVRGAMTTQACETALQKVVQRQDVLRLTILPGKERPLQMIRQSAEPNLRFRELSSAAANDEAVEEMALEVFSKPFDLVKGPLYRVEVLRRGSDDQVLVLAIHHAIADGWTLGVFVQDLCIAYAQGLMGMNEALPSLSISYPAWGAAERAFWQRSELKPRAEFWKARLAGTRRLWKSVPVGGTRSGTLRRWVTYFPADLTEAAQSLGRNAGATLFSTLLAAFQLAISRWTGEDDVLVGTPIANRTTEAVRETMGYFAGIVPLRGRIEPGRSFASSLGVVHEETMNAFANAVPFAELVAALGEPAAPGRPPIFEVRFALQNHPVPDVTLRGLSAKLRMRSTGTARFHLGCEITIVNETLEVVWLYRTELFSAANIENLARMFQFVLSEVCRSPDRRLASLST